MAPILLWGTPLLFVIAYISVMLATGRIMPSQAEPVHRYAPSDLSAEETRRIMEDIVHGEFGLPSDAPLELWGAIRNTDKGHLFISVTLRVPRDETASLIGPDLMQGRPRPEDGPYRYDFYGQPRERAWLDSDFYRLPADLKSAKVETVSLPNGKQFLRVSAPPFDFFSLTHESWVGRPQGLLPTLPLRPPLFP